MHPFSPVPGLHVFYERECGWEFGLRIGVDYFSRGTNTFMYYVGDVSCTVSRHFPVNSPRRDWFAFSAVHGGWYDIQPDEKGGRQGEYGGLGLGVGMRWRLGRGCSLALSVAAGPVYTRYRRYEPQYNNKYLIWQRNEHRWLFIPTDLHVDFRWDIPLRRKTPDM